MSDLFQLAREAKAQLSARQEREKYKRDPGAWAEYKLGFNMWQRQRDIGESIVYNPQTAVAAGHGVGKSMSLAALACWWVDVYWDEDVFLATTAPSASQVNIIWDYIRKFHALSKQRYEDGLVDSPLPGYITGSNQWKDKSRGNAVGEGRKPPNADVDSAFQGRHAQYLLAIIDEAVGVPAGFIEAIGHMATAKHNRQVMIANPTDLTSAMYKEWDKSERGEADWKLMSISVMDSPLIKKDPFVSETEAVGMSGWEFVDRAKKMYGEDSPAFKARVLGEWAQDTGDTVYTAEDIARAHNTVVVPHEDPKLHLGCDISRMGEDLSVVYKLEHGEVWETDELTGKPTRPTGKEGYRLRRVDSWKKAPLTNGDEDNPDSTYRIHTHAHQLAAEVVKVDATGIGGGIIDGLSGYDKRYTLVEVFVGATPEKPKSYVNQRAESAFEFKFDMQRGIIDLDPEDTELSDEMSMVLYEKDTRDRIRLESKDAMRRRGVKSPDYFDACVEMAYVKVDDLFEEEDSGIVALEEDEFNLESASVYLM